MRRALLILIIASCVGWLVFYAIGPIGPKRAVTASIAPQAPAPPEPVAMANPSVPTAALPPAVPSAFPSDEESSDDEPSSEVAETPAPAEPRRLPVFDRMPASGESHLTADVSTSTETEAPTVTLVPPSQMAETVSLDEMETTITGWIEGTSPAATTSSAPQSTASAPQTTSASPSTAAAPQKTASSAQPASPAKVVAGFGFKMSASAKKASAGPSLSVGHVPTGVVEALIASVHRSTPVSSGPVATAAGPATTATSPSFESLLRQSALPIRRMKGAVVISVAPAVFAQDVSRLRFEIEASSLIEHANVSALLVPSALLREPFYVEKLEELRRDLETSAHKRVQPYAYEPAAPVPAASSGIELVLIPHP